MILQINLLEPNPRLNIVGKGESSLAKEEKKKKLKCHRVHLYD